jgi:hypothetical protein
MLKKHISWGALRMRGGKLVTLRGSEEKRKARSTEVHRFFAAPPLPFQAITNADAVITVEKRKTQVEEAEVRRASADKDIARPNSPVS